MSPITVSTALDPASLPDLFRRAVSMAGGDTWRRRIDALQSESRSNPICREFILTKYGLELAFAEIQKYRRNTTRVRWPFRNADEYRLCSFLAMFFGVYDQVNEDGKRKLSGALRMGLEKEFGLGPLAFEMKILTQLMWRGFIVDLNDLEGKGGFDFLARKGSHVIEVECKYISADIGRQIPRHSLCNLGGALWRILEKHSRHGNEARLVHVKLPGRLTKDAGQHESIINGIDAVLAGESVSCNDDFCINIFKFSQSEPSTSTIMTYQSRDIQNIRREIVSRFGIDSENNIFFLKKRHAPIIISFQSEKNDRGLEKIYRMLKGDAERQFSHKLPALFCLHLAELSQDQLRILSQGERKTGTGLQRMASALLQKRPHLHSLAVMAEGEVRFHQDTSDSGMRTCINETGPLLFYRNPTHPLADDPILDQVFLSGRPQVARV